MKRAEVIVQGVNQPRGGGDGDKDAVIMVEEKMEEGKEEKLVRQGLDKILVLGQKSK